MMPRKKHEGNFEFHPLTPERWSDFTALFGANGACGGCWCMWWHETRGEFDRMHGEGNRRRMKRLVEGGEVPGILGYLDGRAAGWCSIAPRESFSSLERSRVLKRLDDLPVWALVCLFVHRDFRRRGVAEALVRAAVSYARSRGAEVVEAYPTVPGGRRLPAVSSFMGVPSLFARAGFVECARPSAKRIVMRHYGGA